MLTKQKEHESKGYSQSYHDRKKLRKMEEGNSTSSMSGEPSGQLSVPGEQLVSVVDTPMKEKNDDLSPTAIACLTTCY